MQNNTITTISTYIERIFNECSLLSAFSLHKCFLFSVKEQSKILTILETLSNSIPICH